MKHILLLFSIFISFASFAQSGTIEIILPDNEKKMIPVAELEGFPIHTIDSIRITNHLKEYRSTLTNIKGVLLKDVLSKISFKEKSPKVLSEYYIICIAEDRYKVVFSWNELFNTSVGEHVLVVPTVKNRPQDGISILSPTDFATGRRYVKMLKTIQIKKINEL